MVSNADGSLQVGQSKLSLPENVTAILRQAAQGGDTKIVFKDSVDPDPNKPIFNPHSDAVISFEEFQEGIDLPSFEFLRDRAMEQVAKYPQYKPEMFDGWIVGKAERDYETKMGLAILKGDFTLFRDSGDDEYPGDYFWSFENAIQTAAPLGTFEPVTLSPKGEAPGRFRLH